jgi:myosin heavy subunit
MFHILQHEALYVFVFLVANIDAAEIPDHSQVQKVAAILGVSKDLLVDALTRKTIFVQGEKVVSFLMYHGF